MNWDALGAIAELLKRSQYFHVGIFGFAGPAKC